MTTILIRIIKFILPVKWHTVLLRYRFSYKYKKEQFALKDDQHVFLSIYNTNMWTSTESVSGGGSELEATLTIRQKLPEIIKQYGITSMLDAPCGDYNWMKEVPKTFTYIGGDIVKEMIDKNQALYAGENVSFSHIDITSSALPKVDLIFCKDCLQHLSYKNIAAAINNFKNSGSRYLLTTSYPLTWRNHDIYDGDFRTLNLFIKPFKLKKPILGIHEKSKCEGVEIDKTMYLFDLQDVSFVQL